MNLRQLWSSIQRWYRGHSKRDQRILAGVVVAIGLSVVYVGVVEPIVKYRRSVAEEISDGLERIERDARFLAAADTLRVDRDDLRKHLEQAQQRLLPAGSGTLGAAALQERANAIAVEKGITVQSTQVMKEEVAEPFRKVSIRLTLSGELKPFSEFVAGLEYGPQQLTIPFAEVSRRGAVAGAKGPRTLAATVEVSGYLLSKAAKPGEGEGAEAEAETAAGGAAGEGTPASPAEGPPDQQAPGAEQPAREGAKPPSPVAPPAPAATPPQPGAEPPAPAAVPPQPAAEPPAPAAALPPPGAEPPPPHAGPPPPAAGPLPPAQDQPAPPAPPATGPRPAPLSEGPSVPPSAGSPAPAAPGGP